MDSAITIIFQLAILIFSVVIHEVSHGLAANALGDPTAKYAGRLTLNPLAHLDPVGSVLLPLLSFFLGGFIIGYAKPVPYNPHLLRVRNQDVGSAMVGIAGPGSNIAIAIIFGLLVRTFSSWAPLFGGAAGALVEVLSSIALINLVLAVFNLIPIPPLDGSKVLFSFLPYHWQGIRIFLERFGFILLLVFIIYFSQWILPLVVWLFHLISGGVSPFR